MLADGAVRPDDVHQQVLDILTEEQVMSHAQVRLVVPLTAAAQQRLWHQTLPTSNQPSATPENRLAHRRPNNRHLPRGR